MLTFSMPRTNERVMSFLPLKKIKYVPYFSSGSPSLEALWAQKKII